MPGCTSCGAQSPEGFRFCGACGAPLTPPAPPRELRKVVTVLFCDVAGSTALGELLDPEALRGVLARYFEEIRVIVERHGGSVEKFIGDAVMAVFGVPRVHEDDALRAVRAAVEIRDRLSVLVGETGVALRFRTGVNTGLVVVGTTDVLATGDAVNVAARLEQAAAPGEILIGAATHGLVRDAVEAEPLEPLRARGKSESVEAFRLARVDPAASGRARRFDLPLVGRTRELGLLHQAYERAVAERGCHLFTLAGAAGIGKSRLMAAFAADVGAGATIASGRCLPYGEGITFWPLVEILDQLGEGAEALRLRITEGSAASPNELFWETRRLLEETAAERPLVLVVDDVQWAEPLLLDLLEHVAKLSRGAAILLVCVARPELLDDRPGWGGGTLNASSVLLGPLNPDQSRSLIKRLDRGLDVDLADRVVQASQGNPLFLEEMVAFARDTGASDVPASIQAVLAARIERLNDAQRQVLECGAIEGEVFHRGVVSTLLTDAVDVDEHLAALVHRELIRPHAPQIPDEEAYRFSHLLIRDAAYDALPKARRADLHQQFTGWLEQQGSDVVELDQIAGWHLEQAIRYRAEIGQPALAALAERAADHLAAAGRAAAGRMDLRGSELLLRRALALVRPDDPRRPMVAVDLAEALTWRGQFGEADALLAEPSTIAGAPAHATLTRCRLLSEIDESAAADMIRNDLAGVREELRRAGDDRGLARVELVQSWLHAYQCQSEACCEAAQRAAFHARRADDRGLLVRALSIQVSHASPGPQPRPVVEQLLDEVEHSDAGRGTTFNVLIERNMLAQYDGRFDQAREFMNAARSALRESGDDLRIPGMGDRAAQLELAAGDPLAAIRILEETRPQLASMGLHGYRSTQTALLAEALYLAGRPEEAEKMAHQAEAESASGDTINLIIIPGVLARVYADRGLTNAAIRFAERAVEAAYRTDQPREHARAELALAYALAAAGRQPEALGAAHRALACYELKGDRTSAAWVEGWISSLTEPSRSESPA